MAEDRRPAPCPARRLPAAAAGRRAASRRAGGTGSTTCAAPRRAPAAPAPASVPLRPCEIDISSNEWFSVWMSMYWPGDGQSCGNVDARRAQPQHRQPIGIGIRQRLQQQRVDDAEDRGVGADADGERRDDDAASGPGCVTACGARSGDPAGMRAWSAFRGQGRTEAHDKSVRSL